jgi:hypothetical protein
MENPLYSYIPIFLYSYVLKFLSSCVLISRPGGSRWNQFCKHYLAIRQKNKKNYLPPGKELKKSHTVSHSDFSTILCKLPGYTGGFINEKSENSKGKRKMKEANKLIYNKTVPAIGRFRLFLNSKFCILNSNQKE